MTTVGEDIVEFKDELHFETFEVILKPESLEKDTDFAF